jgi:fermentation-respiration switch protein FrsA (DUF1100 family)
MSDMRLIVTGAGERRARILVAVGVATLAALGFVGSVMAFGMIQAAPARSMIGAAPPDLHAESVVFASASGATLHGWFVTGHPGSGAVVLMHGIHSNRLSMVRRAVMLGAAGFSVLLFDFQAHGESTGSRITFGHLEALDALAAVAFVRQRLPGERVGTIGVSLGGAAALLGPGPLPVDALVLESVYPDIAAATANRIHAVLGSALGALLAPALARSFELILPPVLGLRVQDLQPIKHIGEVRAPVLIASGTDDDRTTIAESKAMFDRAPSPKTFWAVRGAGHVDLEAYAPTAYRQHVLPFLIAQLRPANPLH